MLLMETPSSRGGSNARHFSIASDVDRQPHAESTRPLSEGDKGEVGESLVLGQPFAALDRRQANKSMVRLGLVEDDEEDESEEEEVRRRVRIQAPGDEEVEEMLSPSRQSSQPSVVYSPGGLFASPTDMAVDERQRGVLGGRETMGLAAQLGLGAESTARAVAAARRSTPTKLSPSYSSSSPASSSRPSTAKRLRRRRSRQLEARSFEAPGRLPSRESISQRSLEAAHETLGSKAANWSAHGKDFGLFMGRSFRASISADGRLARPVVGGQRVAVRSAMVATVPEHSMVVALDRLEPASEGEFPFRAHLSARSALAGAAADYAAAYRDAGDDKSATRWELVQALWFTPESDDGEGALVQVEAPPTSGPPRASLGTVGISRRRRALDREARYEAVCAWLARESATSEDDDDDELADSAPLAVVYRDVAARLCRRDLEGAAERCVEGGEVRLALAIASLEASEARSALELEFEAKEAAATDAGRALLARALGLVAGRLELEDQIFVEQADSPEDRAPWRARLGAHLWYERAGPLSAALDAYEAAAFEKKTASLPLANDKSELDCTYRLLDLARRDSSSRGRHDDGRPLAERDETAVVYAKCLEPFAAGRIAGDVAASWHLHLLLDALRLNSRDRNRRLLASLAEDLVFQLVAQGKGDWALLVVAASHANPATRERLARRLLDRRLYRPRSGGRDDLVAALDTPQAWLDGADALQAGLEGPPTDHVASLVAARAFDKAHVALVAADHLSRAALAAVDVRPLLETLDDHLRHDRDWADNGGLYLDFLRLQRDEPFDPLLAQAVRDKLEHAPPLALQPPLVATATQPLNPHLRAAFHQHLATVLAKDQLRHATRDKRADLSLLDDLSRSTAIAPSARLDILDHIASHIARP